MMGEVIRVSGRAPDVGQFLREAMLSQRFADVALCCPGGQRFLAHRLVLSAASPYLQEVLLAHSKASTHCEPITVILAEVEAPELAAILGFVYTGTATVPRARLNAFLRAADTLRIRLPPVPVAITSRQEAEFKQEDVKDVKISPKYLHCDQYPACDSWYERTDRISYHPDDDQSPRSKKDSYPGSCNEASNLEAPRDPRHLGSLLLDPASQPRPRYGQCPAWPPVVGPGLLNQERAPQRLGQQSPDKEKIVGRMDGRRYHPASIVRPAEIIEKCPPVCDQSMITSQPDSYSPSTGPLEAQSRLEPGLEFRPRPDYGAPGPYVEGRPPSEGCDRGGERHTGNEAAIEGETATVLQYRARSYERADHGEDLSCGERCCRWRVPRRHVANRVTASPWRQIIRPHHLPKIQPMILQTHHTDDPEPVEPVEAAGLPEMPPRASRLSPTLEPNDPANDLYGFEVPTLGPEPTFTENQEPRQDFYPPPQVPSYPRTSPCLVTTLARTETIFQSPPRLLPLANEPLQPISGSCKQSYLGATSQKPELSHPVSRLCDTVEPSERKENNYPLLETKREDEEDEQEERRRSKHQEVAIYPNSDTNNNNDPILASEGQQRGGRTQEDHRCEQCGKTFVTRASLKVHTRTHSGEKPFRCADCGKQFSQLRNYKYHRSVHEGTREFAATCPECGKYFNDRGYLSSHMKIHRNRKEYGCAECGKSFNQRVAYNMHVRIHTGVKPHQCEQCGKAFSRKMLLKQHLRTHSGERPYQCQVCQKAFADRSNMTLHTRLHSGLKPYQCTLCSKAFTKKHHLKTHLNYHTGTKPYSCPNCGLRFSQSSNMRTHFKKCAVNNPAGLKSQESEPTKPDVQVDQRTPNEALTPPNSDQESSILTPISKTPTEPNVT